MAGSSSTLPNPDKPVIVRVKRKAVHSAIDAFWLEIHERPLKKPLLDFEKLSISDASSSNAGELKIKKVFVRHVETVTSSEDTFDVLRTFVPDSPEALNASGKSEEGRKSIKTTKKHDLSLAKAKERQEVLSRNARFEQIWRSRNRSKEDPEDEAIHKICRFYDVVRVDATECEVEIQKEDAELDDCRMLAQYLPLLREVLPTAAEEIESDISKQGLDDYVYDFYAVEEDTDMEIDSKVPFALVKVDDDDFYDGPDNDSDYETDDSNAENNPLNDYPDEEESEDEDEATSQSSSDEDEDEDSDESRSSASSNHGELENGSQGSYEYEDYYDGESYEYEDYYAGESSED